MATIADVAREAGVSASTVSRVMTGAVSVSAQAVAKVRAAVDKIGYRPSKVARSLRIKRATTIGVLVTDIENPFFTTVVRAVEDVAQTNGYSVILCNSDEDLKKEREYVQVLCAEQVAGAIVVPATDRSSSYRQFVEEEIPFVTVDRRLETESADAILVDNLAGSYEAVMHLVKNGFRRIGLISGPPTTMTGRLRRDGYRKALTEAGISLDETLERVGTFKLDSGAKMTAELLDFLPSADALFIANNQMAMGALQTLSRRGVKVPEEIGIVCFDDMPWASFWNIALTTVQQPVYELGSTAASRLFERIRASRHMTCQDIVLSALLCVRRSSQRAALPIEINGKKGQSRSEADPSHRPILGSSSIPEGKAHLEPR
jgi:DNA-binding LacI/PurR family transcriptional regulator